MTAVGHGWEVWRSDGTATGTGLPGAVIQDPLERPTILGALGNEALFFADAGGASPYALFELNVTSGSPIRIDTLYADSSVGAVVDNGRPWLVFAAAASTRIADLEPWASDGTPDAATQLANLHAGTDPGSDPTTLVDVLGTTLFVADDGLTGREP